MRGAVFLLLVAGCSRSYEPADTTYCHFVACRRGPPPLPKTECVFAVNGHFIDGRWMFGYAVAGAGDDEAKAWAYLRERGWRACK